MTAIRKPTRRVATAIALAAGAAIALSACGSGQVSQTAVQQAAVNGNSANLGEIALRNVHIAYPSSEEYSIEPGGSAVLAFTVVNDSAETTDKLVSITTDYAARVIAGEEVGGLTIKPQTSLQAGQLPAGEGAATEAETQIKNNEENDDAPAALTLVVLQDIKAGVRPGLTVPITFKFEKAGSVTVDVPVDAGPQLERNESDKSPDVAEAGH
ncbi:copper chaperone PCu(A)C [Rhodococcus erythropolis]|uniref:copper chaperone PCu(A)C n=1 Tax=Rhodococcus erythropolis TaxID=1833 RepID=UPI00038DC3E1|nr:copper chaperone PCu(A)C [Rhodococcus erythropolis]AGT90539.1 lipoprotein [Rhodococcus erythropolis CCM2595]SUE09343.1 lipoprotein [Rhodococcus erythropolis]